MGCDSAGITERKKCTWPSYLRPNMKWCKEKGEKEKNASKVHGVRQAERKEV